MKKVIVGIFATLMSSAAYSWDGSKSGTIVAIEVASGNNYGFRVWLNGGPELCGNSHKWAYVNASDSNYSVFVSSMLAAKASQSKVTLYTNRKDGSSTGHCHIGHIRVN